MIKRRPPVASSPPADPRVSSRHFSSRPLPSPPVPSRLVSSCLVAFMTLYKCKQTEGAQ